MFFAVVAHNSDLTNSFNKERGTGEEIYRMLVDQHNVKISQLKLFKLRRIKSKEAIFTEKVVVVDCGLTLTYTSYLK